MAKAKCVDASPSQREGGYSPKELVSYGLRPERSSARRSRRAWTFCSSREFIGAMKRPTPGSQKKVTVENLVGLGAERLAEILVGVAETRADLKRRLRMELAAQQGPAALTAEIDKRLGSFETSRGQITWRQGPTFLRDLDALRDLITARLAPLDVAAAIERLWRFIDTARQVSSRYRECRSELDDVFGRAAGDLGAMLGAAPSGPAAAALVESLTKHPSGWTVWLPALLAHAPPSLAHAALGFMAERRGAVPGWMTLIRQLADAAGDVDAFRATYTAQALSTPGGAAEVAGRLLGADRVEEAGDVLRAAAKPAVSGRGVSPVDPDWERVWIDYLERAGRAEEAQAVRWASFERTLSVERARAFIGRLAGFDDVEAEASAVAVAAHYPVFEKGLRFLMEWPALLDAAAMIERRSDEVQAQADDAELWAAKLRRRHPRAAHLLLRKVAEAAFRRRDFKTCDRLTAEAETIGL
jgi:hypothetical protein